MYVCLYLHYYYNNQMSNMTYLHYSRITQLALMLFASPVCFR